MHYGLAILYPVVVLGVLALISSATKTADLSHTHWEKAGANFGLISLSTILVAIITEEGFFRGWFWASLEQVGEKRGRILIWSSVAFALWHWSAVVLNTGFNPPPTQVPVFMINAAVIGAIWGLLRWMSDSVIVASVSHGLWNGGAYALFGFGSKTGALGVKNTAMYGPEVGLLGLALNVIFVVALWTLVRRACDRSAHTEECA
jgi:membrane protease YdiL (CAAX protease family)